MKISSTKWHELCEPSCGFVDDLPQEPNMKHNRRKLLSSFCAFAMVACSLSGVTAQDRKDDGKAGVKTNDAELVDAIKVGVVAQQGDNAFQLISQEAIFDNRLVKGAPFSADIVSETIQTLLDGNRIVQRSEGRIYRDSEGRNRSERAYQMGGSNEQKQTITIYDPVANVNSILDPEARIARKTPFFFGQGGRGKSS
jgi:hypothetical protein